MKKQTWDDFWKSYKEISKAEQWLIEERNRLITDVVRGNCGSRKLSILEVGCGYASNSRILNKDNNYTAYCMDSSNEVIKLVKREIANSIVGDTFNLPFKKERFDLVFSSGLIEHFENPEKLLREMFMVTKKEGLVINSVPGRYSLWQLYKIAHGKNWQHGYEKSYTHQNLLRITTSAIGENKYLLLKSGGFDPLSIRGLFLKLTGINIPITTAPHKDAYTEIYQVYQKK